MNNALAIVIVSCDTHEFIWKPWYHYFAKNFGFDYPVYLLTETKQPELDGVTVINVNIPDINKWTRKLRESLKQIPYKHLFVMMDDFLILKRIDIAGVYEQFKNTGADAFRIMDGPNKHCREYLTDLTVEGNSVYELLNDSDYLVSFSPNIWKRNFLISAIQVDESPWSCELSGRWRGRRLYVLSMVVDGWFCGAVRRGRLTGRGQQIVDEI